jgi:hypothetical protein
MKNDEDVGEGVTKKWRKSGCIDHKEGCKQEWCSGQLLFIL